MGGLPRFSHAWQASYGDVNADPDCGTLRGRGRTRSSGPEGAEGRAAEAATAVGVSPGNSVMQADQTEVDDRT